MARSLRSDPPGGIHHVYHRALEPHDCFMDDRDRSVFLQLVGEGCERVAGSVLAYCLMGNHYHLVARLPDGGLANLMKSVSQQYTSLFNAFHERSGAIFRGRYASKLVDSDGYLVNLTRYLHRNPLEMTYRIHPYPWSSYAAYIGARTPFPWLDRSFVLALGSGSDGYRRFVEADVAADKAPLAAGVRTLGTQPALGRTFGSFAGVDEAVQIATGIDPKASGRRRPDVPRLLAVLLASERCVVDAQHVAHHYGYGSRSSLRSATAAARRLADTDVAVHGLYQKARLLLDGGQNPVQ